MKKPVAIVVVLLVCIIAATTSIFIKDTGINIPTDEHSRIASKPVTNKSTPQVEQPLDVITARIQLMESLQEAILTLQGIIWNPLAFDANSIQEQAQIILNGSEKMLALFPKGSVNESSRARPEIWNDWQLFKKLADESKRLAQQLKTSVQANTDSTVSAAGRNPMRMLNPNTAATPTIPNISPTPSTPGVTNHPSYAGALALPGIPNLPTPGLPNSMGVPVQSANNMSGIRIGSDGQVILPPEITFQLLTGTCTDCHSKFLTQAQQKSRATE